MKAVTTLNRHTMQLFDAIKADGVAFEMHESGLLCAFATEAGYQKSLAALQAIDATIGLEIHELKGASLMAREPSLTHDVVGAVFLPGERHVKPESTSSSGVGSAWARRAGAQPGTIPAPAISETMNNLCILMGIPS